MTDRAPASHTETRGNMTTPSGIRRINFERIEGCVFYDDLAQRLHVMWKIFTPVWRIVGEFITLGTLYNDMGIDCMEINGIQGVNLTRQWTRVAARGIARITLRGFSFFLFYLLYPEISSNVWEENVNILLAKMLTSIWFKNVWKRGSVSGAPWPVLSQSQCSPRGPIMPRIRLGRNISAAAAAGRINIGPGRK